MARHPNPNQSRPQPGPFAMPTNVGMPTEDQDEPVDPKDDMELTPEQREAAAAAMAEEKLAEEIGEEPAPAKPVTKAEKAKARRVGAVDAAPIDTYQDPPNPMLPQGMKRRPAWGVLYRNTSPHVIKQRFKNAENEDFSITWQPDGEQGCVQPVPSTIARVMEARAPQCLPCDDTGEVIGTVKAK